MLYTETVEAGTLDLTRQLMSDEVFKDFYLVGGTALSLKLGHRKSIDIDLFTDKDFDSAKIKNHLQQHYQVEKLQAIKNGVFGLVSDVKVDLIAHQYPLIKPIETVEGIRMLSLEDIGAMKLQAIIQNGSRLKDFVDVYALLNQRSLKQLTDAMEQKYPDVSRGMAQNALLYHNDIDFTVPIKLMKQELDWNKIYKRLHEAIVNTQKIFQKKNQSLDLKKPRKPSENLKQKKQGRRPKL
jgi:hypothetical protein